VDNVDYQGENSMNKLGIQLYSVREDLKKDYYGVLKKLVDFGYTEIEPAGFFGPSVGQAKQWFDELRLHVPSIHSSMPYGEQHEKVFHEAQILQCKDIITGAGRQTFTTIDEVKRWCDRMNTAAADAATHGMRVGYHNHDWEFNEVAASGTSGYDLLIENLDTGVFFEVDAYWVRVGGSMPEEIIARLGPRCSYLHIKDGNGNRDVPNTAVGQGIMTWDAVFQAAIHATAAYVELDSCATPMMDAVASSATYLIGKGLVYGN
jgi:sugar phosphate isomerase/epimerase